LTNTLSVGQVSDAAIHHMVDAYPGIGDEHDVIIPVVGECDDSWLNDIGGRHVHEEHVFEALRTASEGPVAEGNVGGGTGMVTCDFKGGIGTSSRKLPEVLGGYTLGVLVMSNFGLMHNLRVSGLPVGEMLADRFAGLARREDNYGSIIAIVATDAPLQSHQLNRLAKRVSLGIGRAGSFAAHGSGEIIVCFSTANRIPRRTQKMVYRIKVLLDRRLDALYEAVIECTEEAILNSLCMARDMEGANGHFAPALPLDIVRQYVQSCSLAMHPVPPRPAQKPPAEPPSELRSKEALPSATRGAEGMAPMAPASTPSAKSAAVVPAPAPEKPETKR
jgi:D-aminopeptidase